MIAIWWIRRDMRLGDNPALVAAARAGRVLPVFIRDDCVDGLGAAPKWRMGLGLDHLAARIADLGGRVILRSGPAQEVLDQLVSETGATTVVWNRLYDKQAIARDSAVKAALTARGVQAQSFGGHLLFEPWTVSTKTGGYYKVYSPFWRAVKDTDVPAPMPVPDAEWADADVPSESLDDWAMGRAMQRGARIVARHVTVGEAAARARLNDFVDARIADYKAKRDFPAEPACSGLSENLTYGEISPRTIWHAGRAALYAAPDGRHEFSQGGAGAEHFLKELVWREFAYHLLYHEPDLPTKNHRDGWDSFPWRTDTPDARAWREGRTGEPFVDAAMRELYVTGTMHNRARMIVASYLTKHLMTHWTVGLKWFEECLIDWDPASNAMGWQWVAGCGPDAAPYFRVFNPATQAQKFDPQKTYLDRWIAEGRSDPHADGLSFFEAIPASWGHSATDAYPAPIVTLAEGRERALSAYAARG